MRDLTSFIKEINKFKDQLKEKEITGFLAKRVETDLFNRLMEEDIQPIFDDSFETV